MKVDLTNIKNIIFDLGNVLIDLHFDETIKAFQELGMKTEVVDYRHAYAAPAFYNLEVGKITVEEFRDEMRIFLQNPNATDKEIEDAWYKIIGKVSPERLQVLQTLKKSYNLYLFSNTNKIHIDRFHPEFKEQHGIEFPSLFVMDFYSHEIHDRKPEVSSFEKIINLSGINPAESVFIDDIEVNCQAAEKAGLNSFWLKEGMEMAELF